MDTVEYTGVYEIFYHLHEYFQQAYALGFCLSFRYEDQYGPTQLLGYLHYPPNVLYYVYQTHPLLSPRGVLRALPGTILPHPLFKMIRTELGVSICFKGVQSMNCGLRL